MKSLAQHLDYLHDIVKQYGLSEVNNLPEIVVVGDQSSGKSSLLQSIIRKDILPHGDKLVTRCPIRVLTSKNEREFATFHDMPGQEFKISEISEILLKKNQEIQKEEYISSNDILINLHGPDMLNLTLVDLPGIVKIRLQNQPKNIVAKVEKLITDRIKNENTLILAVVSAANDLASSSALALAKSVDKFGKRTIIVFTMMDRCQHPTNIVENFELNSELGFLGVICRSPSQISQNMTIDKQFEYESQFFENHPVYTHYKRILGMDNLVSKIESEFRRSLCTSLPELKAQIDSKIEIILKELAVLGEPVRFLDNQILFVQGQFEKLMLKMEEIIDGKELEMEDLVTDGICLREIFMNFNEKISGYQFNKDDKAFEKIRNNIKRSRGLEGVSAVSLQLLKKLMKSLILPFNELVKKSLDEIKTQFELLFKGLLPKCCFRYKKLLSICESSFEIVTLENEEFTIERLDSLISLEYETIESDFNNEVCGDNMDSFHSFINKMFLSSKSNLKYNMPKIIKQFFIRKSISDIKENMINLAIQEINNGVDLVPEATEYEIRRKSLVKSRDGLKTLKKALEAFKRSII